MRTIKGESLDYAQAELARAGSAGSILPFSYGRQDAGGADRCEVESQLQGALYGVCKVSGEPLGTERLLPIGSVVFLEGGHMPLMVFDRTRTAIGNGRFWDYAAVPYPEGSSDREHACLSSRS